MGGAASEVSATTTDVIVESAIFDPVAIRRTGQRYALRSEASLRFEKGQEFRLARIGADRVAGLIAAWAGASVAPGRVDTASIEPEAGRLAFRPARINRLLGTRLEPAEQRAILARAGIASAEIAGASPIRVSGQPQPLTVDAGPGEACSAVVPTWRADLEIENDLAEEIARVIGYESIPAMLPDTAMPTFIESPLGVRNLVRQTLAGAGLTEVITSALVSPRLVELFQPAVPETASCRATIGRRAAHPGGQSALCRPLGPAPGPRGKPARGGRHQPGPGPAGRGGLRAGQGLRLRRAGERRARMVAARPGPDRRQPAGGLGPGGEDWLLDDAKGLIELLAERLGLARPAWTPLTAEPVYHPGRSAIGLSDGALAGRAGELHPAIRAELDLRAERVVIAEFAIRGLNGGPAPEVRVEPIPRFPPVGRDLAVVVDRTISAAAVEQVIRSAAGPLLRNVRLFDIYRGTPLLPSEQSLAWRLTSRRTTGP